MPVTWNLQVNPKATGPSGFPLVFEGAPDAAVSSIGGSITASRTSGQLPCYVHVSASGITAVGTMPGSIGLRPYEDVEFSWDFGDPSGTETFTSYRYPTSTVNSNNTQTGPEAVYVYRTVGTKTITLRARAKNGSGGFTTAVFTQNITVSQYVGVGTATEIYVDSNAAGGGSGTIGSPFNDLAHIRTQLGIANSIIHVKRNSSFDISAVVPALNISASPMRMDAYGSGSDPVYTQTSGSICAIRINTNQSDVVLSNQNIQINGGTIFNDAGVEINDNSGGITQDIYFDNIVVNTTVGLPKICIFMQYDVTNFTNAVQMLRGGLWKCTLTSAASAVTGAQLYSGPYQWFFLYGLTTFASGSDPIRDQYIYPQTRYNSAYRYCDFQPSSTAQKNNCINTNFDPITGGPAQPQYAEFLCMAENNFAATNLVTAFDGSNGDNNPAETLFRNFVVQYNNSSMQQLADPFCTEHITIRGNVCWNLTSDFVYTQNDKFAAWQVRAYNNKIYKPSRPSGPFGEGIWTFWQVTATLPQYFVDNQHWDNGTGPDFWEMNPISGYVSNGSLIDRNTYWFPNGSTPFIDAGPTGKSFAAWQALGFDVNGSVTNPGWPNPGSGNFG